MSHTKTDTPEGATTADESARGDLQGSLIVAARAGRIDLTFAGRTIALAAPRDVDAMVEMLRACPRGVWIDPGNVDAMVEMLRASRAAIWGNPEEVS